MRPKTQENVRLFLALLLPRELGQKLLELQQNLQGESWEVSWTPVQRFHLTLHFLGKTPVRVLGDLERELCACVHGLRPFELSASGLGVFPDVETPRILWAGAEDRHGKLQDLFERSLKVLSRYRLFKLSQTFTPHITLGRVRDLNHWDRHRLAGLRGDWKRLGRLPVEEVVMMKSTTGKDGTQYQRVFGAKLGGQG